MESIEEYDVDISNLWKWKKEVVLKEGDKTLLKGYLRLPGDADVNRARVFALRESAKLRKKLRDEEDFDRYAYITPFELMDYETLLEYTTALLLRERISEISKEVDIPIPARPDDDASTEEQEKYQEKVDNWVKERYDKIQQLSEKAKNEITNQLSALSKEDLYKIYADKSIDLYCESLIAEVFTEQCIFYGLFKDSTYKKRMFNDFDEFQNLPTYVKDFLKREYETLIITTEELKK